MFSKTKINDKVWSINYGWGKISDIEEGVIGVKFSNYLFDEYTFDGVKDGDMYPTLFWDEIQFETPKQPKRKVRKFIVIFTNNHDKMGVFGNSYFPEFYDTYEEASVATKRCCCYPSQIVKIEVEE